MTRTFTLTVDVTVEDLGEGSHLAYDCPDSKAITRALLKVRPDLEDTFFVAVAPVSELHWGASIVCVKSVSGGNISADIRLPDEEAQRLWAYDGPSGGTPMVPHTFEIDVPVTFIDYHAVFETVLAEADRLGWPVRYEGDLTHDHRGIERDQPLRFVWAIYDSGTHIVDPDKPQAEELMQALINVYSHARYYTWSLKTGLQYVEDPKMAQLWLADVTELDAAALSEAVHA